MRTLITGSAIAPSRMPSLISIVVVLSSLPARLDIICYTGCSLHVGPGRAYRVSDVASGNHSGEQGEKQTNGKGSQRGAPTR